MLPPPPFLKAPSTAMGLIQLPSATSHWSLGSHGCSSIPASEASNSSW